MSSDFGEAIININNTAPVPSSGVGLYIQTASGSAVRAHTDGTSVSDHAGLFTSNTGYGIYGHSTVNSGVYGQTEGFDTVGVWGLGIGPNWNHGVYGTSEMGRGVVGVDGGSNPDDSYALYAVGDLYVTDDSYVQGTKSAVVQTGDGDERLMYSIESPEVWFEDLGSANLVAGQATVIIEPIFAQTVYLAAADYHVQITPVSSEPVIVFITAKTPTSFTVEGVKLDGTPATCTFDY